MDGVFGDKANPPAGQAAAVDALEDCFRLVSDLQETASPYSGRVAVVHGALLKHKAHLECLLEAAGGGQPSTHDEFELKRIQGHVSEIDAEFSASTPNGWGVENGVVPPGQAECSELVAEIHGLIEKFQELDKA